MALLLSIGPVRFSSDLMLGGRLWPLSRLYTRRYNILPAPELRALQITYLLQVVVVLTLSTIDAWVYGMIHARKARRTRYHAMALWERGRKTARKSSTMLQVHHELCPTI